VVPHAARADAGHSSLELQSLNPNYADRTLNAPDVEWIARIVWVSQ
jgi:phage repressor protein C with HTH and peptisase S24 domain